MLNIVLAVFGVILLIIAVVNVFYTFMNLSLIVMKKDYIYYFTTSDGKRVKVNLTFDAFRDTVAAILAADVGFHLLGTDISVLGAITNFVRGLF